MRAVGGHGGLRPLPPLNLVAVPTANDGPLQPAPVQVPPSLNPSYAAVPDAGVARHTVVVQHFDGARPAQNFAPGAGADGSAPASHIEITIDRSPVSGGAPAVGGSASSVGAGGEGYQQAAFALQQQGDYSQAQTSYQKAVRAYQAQIASGRDVDAAERGLQACKTGLQICQQSQ